MATAKVNGLTIAYEIVGTGPRSAVITPGGRYSKDIAGIRELAEQLADGGLRVLIWDRPNCGASDVCFDGESESVQNADTLAGLLHTLGMAPACVIAGSGGSREALLAAIRHPEVVERLFIFWISGGSIGLSVLPFAYCHDSAVAAAEFGMPAVVELPAWQEQLTKNPGNRNRLLALDPQEFVEKMHAWGGSFFPLEGSPVPCIKADEYTKIDRPVMILRSGRMDMHHTRATSEAVHALIPGSLIAEPPWDEHEWPNRMRGFTKGESAAGAWPLLAPQILDFCGL